ncbi:UDP-2,4-diacetamido-2,4,6-trideoxy-beta-L-altropyranose hydrolase [Vibrio breoganii]|nr:UDP-2,4-diacetamido-2,4,6-trideoxy-beta-L-altropyranose hydrolase [Vibrio breoganii]
MVNFVFRVDASVYIGSGHVMRCLVLAKALREEGYSILFTCLPQKGDMIGYIAQQGFDVISLTPTQNVSIPESTEDYVAWLQRTPLEDACDFLSFVDDADWVITDHYAIDKQWHKKIRGSLHCQIISIDDLMREHDADVIIDQTLNRLAADYHSNRLVLAGTQYALLRDEFSNLRKQASKRVCPTTNVKVLLSMGGIDAPNATLRSLKALQNQSRLSFTVLLSVRSPNFNVVQQWCSTSKNAEHIAFSNDVAGLMLEHDVAIGAPGSTSWERACLGLPSVIIPLAENQTDICHQLVKSRASIKVDLETIERELAPAVENLIDNWNEYSQNNFLLCDGLGTQRVVEKINGTNNEYNTTL